eukprot:GGOE01043908.1.p1 GENE.GGOE01043908.1~~GGOE01043908.1.p1  ORF type:complete len:793 (-),score=266.87 GGOE01043908.1:235-2613(-)
MSVAFEPFLLRAELSHDEDVRGVDAFPLLEGGILTASRDRTAKLWALQDGNYACARTFVGHEHGVFQAICHNGAVATCSQDKTLITWDWESANPITFLTGHTGPVSCCASSPVDGRLISGSWDSTLIIWAPDGTAQHTLQGHTKNVLCVCWLTVDQILSGSGDRSIIMWSSAGQKQKVLTGHTDAIRAVKEVPEIGFISSSNDCTLIVWSYAGDQLQILAEHSNLVYCVAVLSTDEFLSGSEDKTLRVWRGGECVQTIPHPAMVWDVAVLSNGDIVSGGSDGKARVWTRQKDRANATLIQALEGQLAKQEVNTKVVGGVDVTKLPGEEALAVPGTKDGQIKMVKRKGHPTAEVYSWSAFDGKWSKTGDLMDSPGDTATMGRQELNGVMYDCVFPVELNTGSGKFRLGYNRGENPYTAAQRFIWENEEQGMGQHFLDDIANFIIQNTEQVATEDSGAFSEYAQEAARLAAEGQPTILAPKEALKQLEGQQVAFSSYMQEALRYEQEEKARAAGVPAASASGRAEYPLTVYTTFAQPLNVEGVCKKVLELGTEISAQALDAALSTADTGVLQGLLQAVQNCSVPSDIDFQFLQRLLSWPEGKRFPAVDVLRMLLLHEDSAAVLAATHIDTVLLPLTQFLQDTTSAPEQMLICRALCNMFPSASLQPVVASHALEVLHRGKSQMKSKSNNMRQAFAALLNNFAILFAQSGAAEDTIAAFCPIATEFLLYEAQPQVTVALCGAVGTLLHASSRVRAEACDGFQKCFLADCLRGKTTFGDEQVIAFAKALLTDYFAE